LKKAKRKGFRMLIQGATETNSDPCRARRKLKGSPVRWLLQPTSYRAVLSREPARRTESELDSEVKVCIQFRQGSPKTGSDPDFCQRLVPFEARVLMFLKRNWSWPRSEIQEAYPFEALWFRRSAKSSSLRVPASEFPSSGLSPSMAAG
jgi:hypothetical protein